MSDGFIVRGTLWSNTRRWLRRRRPLMVPRGHPFWSKTLNAITRLYVPRRRARRRGEHGVEARARHGDETGTDMLVYRSCYRCMFLCCAQSTPSLCGEMLRWYGFAQVRTHVNSYTLLANFIHVHALLTSSFTCPFHHCSQVHYA
jgi:hypothetical protein